MSDRRRVTLTGAALVAACGALAGCSQVKEKPGNPDSVSTAGISASSPRIVNPDAHVSFDEFPDPDTLHKRKDDGALGEPGTWRIVEAGPDGKSIEIEAEVAHGGCSYPVAQAKRTAQDRVAIRVVLGSGGCGQFETAELVSGGRITVGLPVKSSLEEVQVDGPGYRGVVKPGRYPATTYPNVVGFSVPMAQQILRANHVRSVDVVGPVGDGDTVRAQWPAAYTSYPLSWHEQREAGRSVATTPPRSLPGATLDALPQGTYEYPVPTKFTCAQERRLTMRERSTLPPQRLAKGCPDGPAQR